MYKKKQRTAAEIEQIRRKAGFFTRPLGKNTCIAAAFVILYFSIPHGASTFCLCPDRKRPGWQGG